MHILLHAHDDGTPISSQHGWNTLEILKMSLAEDGERITGVLVCHFVHQTNPLPMLVLKSNFYHHHKSACCVCWHRRTL